MARLVNDERMKAGRIIFSEKKPAPTRVPSTTNYRHDNYQDFVRRGGGEGGGMVVMDLGLFSC